MNKPDTDREEPQQKKVAGIIVKSNYLVALDRHNTFCYKPDRIEYTIHRKQMKRDNNSSPPAKLLIIILVYLISAVEANAYNDQVN